jgi:hypothetical protein
MAEAKAKAMHSYVEQRRLPANARDRSALTFSRLLVSAGAARAEPRRTGSDHHMLSDLGSGAIGRKAATAQEAPKMRDGQRVEVNLSPGAVDIFHPGTVLNAQEQTVWLDGYPDGDRVVKHCDIRCWRPARSRPGTPATSR